VRRAPASLKAFSMDWRQSNGQHQHLLYKYRIQEGGKRTVFRCSGYRLPCGDTRPEVRNVSFTKRGLQSGLIPSRVLRPASVFVCEW